MTDELIKQNAEEYASKLVERDYYEDMWLDLYDAYIEGAHSRDEEIKELKDEIESLKENEKELFESFKKRGTKLGELMKENVKLRNPWRDASKELPPKFIDDIGEKYEQSIPVAVKTKNSNHWHMAEYYYDTKEWLCEENNTYIIRDEVTHWMPIPELKKEE